MVIQTLDQSCEMCVFHVQEELVTLRRQLDGRDGDLRRLQDETGSRSPTPAGLDSTERGGSCIIAVLHT